MEHGHRNAGELSRRRHRPILMLGIVCACFVSACRGKSLTEVPITVERSNPAPCGDTLGGSPRSMNAYIVDVLSLPEGEPAEENQCSQCQGMQTCARARRTCVCGDDVAPETGALANALSGLRFEDLDPTDAYCVRVIAVERDDASAADESATCACDERSWLASELSENPTMEPTRIRACAMSTTEVRLDAPEAAIRLDLICGDDHPSDSPAGPLTFCSGLLVVRASTPP